MNLKSILKKIEKKYNKWTRLIIYFDGSGFLENVNNVNSCLPFQTKFSFDTLKELEKKLNEKE